MDCHFISSSPPDGPFHYPHKGYHSTERNGVRESMASGGVATASTGGRRGHGRVPGYVNLSVAIVIGLLVAVVALRAANTQPPAIAEFAPQAQQQIKDAPQEQTSLAGSGE